MSDTSSDDNFNARHPDSQFKTEYPYNNSTITRSGHEFHVNDAPGSESLKTAHTKGTYTEIGKYGDLNQVVVDKANYYYADGHTTTIDGHKDEKIGGAYNLNIGNNDSTGSYNLTVSGGPLLLNTNDHLYLGGKITDIMSADNLEMGVGGNFNSQIKGNKSDLIQGDYNEIIVGNKSSTSSGDISLSAQGISLKGTLDNIDINSTFDVNVVGGLRSHIGSDALITIITPAGAIIVKAGGVISITANGAINITSEGPINMTSASLINMTAPIIKIN
jgi:prepilin-type processing-associated H-X9-DG protein